MRLADLEPHWLNEHVFAFRCPHCRKDWLTCKSVAMGSKAQWELYDSVFGENANQDVVPTREEFAWTITGRDFATMTVTPSINAEASGHWHGNITNGETTP